MKIEPLPIGMKFKRMQVILVSQETAKQVKLAFKKEDVFHKFRSYAIEDWLTERGGFSLPEKIEEYEPHHVKPVSLGGTNDFGNLALVHPDRHALLHRHITNALKNMKEGEAKIVDLPYMPSLIWAPIQRNSGHGKSFLMLQNPL